MARPLLPAARLPGGCPERGRVALARFMCSAAARSVPAPPLPALPANQGGDPGAATRARSSPAGHSWIPDKGLKGGEGGGERGARLRLLSPLRPRPSNSRILKEPHPAGSPVWPPAAPQTPPEDPLCCGARPEPLRVPDGSLRGSGRAMSVCDPPTSGARGGTGAGCPDARRGQVSPDSRGHPAPCSAGRASPPPSLREGTRRLPRRVSLPLGDFCLGVRSPLPVPCDDAPNFSDGGA